MNATANISIRSPHHDDYSAIWQVAALDDALVPAGELLVAELDGEIVAALSLTSGESIADPFRRSAEALDLLRLRAGQLTREQAGARRVLRRLRPAPAA